MKLVRQLLAFFKKWFWTIPIAEDTPLKATDVLDHFICVKYKRQWVNMRKSELTRWNASPRNIKRGIAQKTAQQVKKGYVRFEKINGKMTCIKNKSYDE